LILTFYFTFADDTFVNDVKLSKSLELEVTLNVNVVVTIT